MVYSLAFGLAHIITEPFFTGRIWRKDEDIKEFVETLRYAIITLLQAPYVVGGAVAVILYYVLPKDMELDQPMPTTGQGSQYIDAPGA